MKLELTHLAPYLPYGLKVQLSKKGIFNLDEEFPQSHNEICEITNLVKCNNNWEVEISSDKDYSYGLIELDEIAPLLLPLSALYEEIDGEIGIVELAKLADALFDEVISITTLSNYTSMGHVDYYTTDGLECRFGWYNSFQQGYINPTRHRPGSNQLALFEYLFSHHYDVFDLCSKGLAIDKRSVK